MDPEIKKIHEEKAAVVHVRSRRQDIICISGPSGSGKTYTALRMANLLNIPPIIIDDDALRLYVTSDLSFSAEDRAKNNEIAGRIAVLLWAQGHLVIITTIRADLAAKWIRENHPDVGVKEIVKKLPDEPTNR